MFDKDMEIIKRHFRESLIITDPSLSGMIATFKLIRVDGNLISGVRIYSKDKQAYYDIDDKDDNYVRTICIYYMGSTDNDTCRPNNFKTLHIQKYYGTNICVDDTGREYQYPISIHNILREFTMEV